MTIESKPLPKVSVIMPVYNGERFVKQAVDSLLTQTFQDWELVVVDDGSTDSTPLILERFVDPRITVIKQMNGGEARARNTGLDHVRGEYMAFLDADDIYFPNALEDLSSFLDNNPNYGAVFSDGYIFDQNDIRLMRLTDVRPGIFTGDILNPLVITPSVITVPVCTMTRISNIRKHGLQFDEKNNLIGTDWDFWIRLAVHVQFGYLDKITCQYRIHPANLTRVTGSEKRRRDQTYRQMKIMNSDWFGRLSQNTRELFFYDMLSNALTGDVELQLQILKSEQFAGISATKRADLWRLVGIDVLKNSRNAELAKTCFSQSFNLNTGDWKTRSLLWSLRFGSIPALMFIRLWHFLLHFRTRISSSRNSPSERLQKMLGVR